VYHFPALIWLFLPLFRVSAYADKPLLARLIGVAKIGIAIVRGAEHVAVFYRPVNDCSFVEGPNCIYAVSEKIH
jgi:hypothetical protein